MCHVLVIEDEPLVAMLIEDTLAEAGATSFDFAATEDEAVSLAVAHPPGFITVDQTLAQGRGVNAVNRIRRRVGPIEVVVISGDLEPELPNPPPVCAVLPKPFLTERLASVFRARAPLG